MSEVYEKLIDGVRIKNLKASFDERGSSLRLFDKGDPFFGDKLDHASLTSVLPGVVKCWSAHEKSDNIYIGIKGWIKFVLYDARKSSPTYGLINEIFLNEHNYQAINVPAGVFHGWKGAGTEMSYVFQYFPQNAGKETKLPYDTKEIKYNWALHLGELSYHKYKTE